MINIPNWQLSIKFEIKNDEHNPGEKRYCVETTDDQRLFLRLSDKTRYERNKNYDRKKIEHEMMARVYNLGVPTAKPIDFGLFYDENGEKNIYSLSSWIDNGEELEKIIRFLTETDQYNIGINAGKNLRLIHSIPAPDKTPEDWETQLNNEIDWRLQECLKSNNNYINKEYIFNYIEKNRYLLKNRPQCLQHHDYSLRNVFLVNKSEVYVIDFADYDFGDAWYDFCFLFADEFPHFLTGLINGYFNNSIPETFFPTLQFYHFINSLQNFVYYEKFNEDMNNPVQSWYLSDRTK